MAARDSGQGRGAGLYAHAMRELEGDGSVSLGRRAIRDRKRAAKARRGSDPAIEGTMDEQRTNSERAG